MSGQNLNSNASANGAPTPAATQPNAVPPSSSVTPQESKDLKMDKIEFLKQQLQSYGLPPHVQLSLASTVEDMLKDSDRGADITFKMAMNGVESCLKMLESCAGATPEEVDGFRRNVTELGPTGTNTDLFAVTGPLFATLSERRNTTIQSTASAGQASGKASGTQLPPPPPQQQQNQAPPAPQQVIPTQQGTNMPPPQQAPTGGALPQQGGGALPPPQQYVPSSASSSPAAAPKPPMSPYLNGNIGRQTWNSRTSWSFSKPSNSHVSSQASATGNGGGGAPPAQAHAPPPPANFLPSAASHSGAKRNYDSMNGGAGGKSMIDEFLEMESKNKS